MAMVSLRNLVTKELYTLTAKRDDYNADNVTSALANHLDVKTHSLLLLDMGDERYPHGLIVKRSDKVSRELAFVFNEGMQFFRAHIKGKITLTHLSWTST